jgi:hypothetical protein
VADGLLSTIGTPVADRISSGHRREVLDAIERINGELGAISTWLSGLDEDQAAIELEHAWRATPAAGWLLERPLRRSAGQTSG